MSQLNDEFVVTPKDWCAEHCMHPMECLPLHVPEYFERMRDHAAHA